MKILYLGHSGFLAENDEAYFVFDYIRGDIPDLSRDKKLYVFASHAHRDHFYAGIFTDPQLSHADAFILGFDIEQVFRKLARKTPALSDLPVLWACPQQPVETEGFTCLPLLSTDEGVAFPVCTEKEVIYHAGDLNRWH